MKFLLFVWQLPQHLLALALIKILKAEKKTSKTGVGDIEWYLFKREGGFSYFFSGTSLGRYILLPSEDTVTILHEYGHCRQSLMFGWLYLLVIGVPSVINNLWDRYRHKNWSAADRVKWYYSRYPEKWADELGGVKRF